jgi:hypothetical protein
MEKMYIWDVATRAGFVDFRGGELQVHEFPYDGVNNVIYNENGVVVRSIPAIHAIDGAVSFILEWNGLKFVYGGDTFPNKCRRQRGHPDAVFPAVIPTTGTLKNLKINPLRSGQACESRTFGLNMHPGRVLA